MQQLKSYFTKDGWKKDFETTCLDFNQAAKAVVAAYLPGSLILGRSGILGKLGSWYRRNGYFLYKLGSELELAPGNFFGYPNKRGKVIGFDTNVGDFYLLEVPDGVEKHFKWNIEHQWRMAA